MLIKTYLTRAKEISIYSDTMMCQGEKEILLSKYFFKVTYLEEKLSPTL